MKRLIAPLLILLSSSLFILTLIQSYARQRQITEGWIVFIGKYNGQDELYRMWSDGRLVRRLTNIPNYTDYERVMHPAPSPDGRWIVFVSNHTDSDELFLIPAGGGQAQQLTHNLSHESNPSWMPDGQSILFYSDRFHHNGYYRLPLGQTDIDTAAPFWVQPAQDYYLTVSPQGEEILFSRTYPRGEGSEINVMQATIEGEAPPVRLTNQAWFNDTQPAWSPDEKQIAFASTRYTLAPLSFYGIFLMDATGNNIQRLTASHHHINFYEPRWSADGRTLIFWGQINSYQPAQIYRMPPTPNVEPIPLTPPNLMARQPSWMLLVESAWRPFWLLIAAVALWVIGLGLRVSR